MPRGTRNHGNHEVLLRELRKYLGTLHTLEEYSCLKSKWPHLLEERDKSPWVNFGWSQLMAFYMENNFGSASYIVS